MLPLVLLASVQAVVVAPPPPGPPWPTIKPGRIVASPDWSDYRIYPMPAREKNEEGRVLPELLVGVDGKPQSCRIVSSSTFAELDEGSCNLMMQMRFEPARDSAGRAVPSRYSRPLVWLLSDPRPFASSSLKVRVSIADGHQTACTVVGGDGPLASPWTALACAMFADVDYYFGSSASKTMAATFEVRLDAGDHAPLLNNPWPAGEIVSDQTIAFAVNGDGDPVACAPVESRGVGPRGMNNLSPCGGLLSSLWFEDPAPGAPPRKGVMETRVYALKGG